MQQLHNMALMICKQKHQDEAVTDYIGAWWPPGHIIGWEHTFIHEVKDLVEAIAKKQSVAPDFYDGMRCQQVLDAAMLSSVETVQGMSRIQSR